MTYTTGLNFLSPLPYIAGMDFVFLDNNNSQLSVSTITLIGSTLTSVFNVASQSSQLSSGTISLMGGTSVPVVPDIFGFLVLDYIGVPTTDIKYISAPLTYTVDYWTGHDNVLPTPMYGTYADNMPMTLTSYSYNGWISEYYFYDFYFHIHIVPNPMDVGFVVNEKTTSVEVWNSYLTTKTLTGVTSVNDAGITLATGTLPLTFNILQSIHMAIDITTSGPPIIDAIYTFNFSGIILYFTLIGTRSIIMGFLPLEAHKETRDFLTDVLRTITTEDRYVIRAKPRETQDVQYLFQSSEEFAIAQNMLKHVGHYKIALPEWEDYITVHGIAAGNSYFPIDTVNREFEVDKYVIVWASNTNYEALQIASITSTQLAFHTNIKNTYAVANVAPLKIGFASSYTYDRIAPDKAVLKVSFLILDTYFNPIWTPAATYNGLPVMDSDYCVSLGMRDNHSRILNIFDNSIGNFTSYPMESTTKMRQTLTFACYGKAQMWKVKRQLDWLQGKYKAFYMASGNNDLIALDTVHPTTNTLQVKYAGWSVYGWQDIVIYGSITKYLHVTNVQSESPGTETLYFSEYITSGIQSIRSIQRLYKSRLDADKIEIVHDTINSMQVVIPVTEIN